MGNAELYNMWMKYAKADYDAATHLANHHPVHMEIVCFHCQQAGEKALKAILAYHDEEIPRSHDLYELLVRVEIYCKGTADMFSDLADQLTNFAVVTRYPNGEMEVTKEDMELALLNAEQILKHIGNLEILGGSSNEQT